ncbi:BA14K family protein [Mesorhizobium sp. M7A.F.Ca.CA.001.12.2.1]|nr:BA14K family protein [Mesorhizobium sp. M7A.F.Ca.CA.001.12.2.1]RUZ27519.1 BA14K family protein [Mesorhizobium sp. M7A.F.Ca.US.007.01.2.1]RUZ46633.1 BA14K family protein [Mesorhizobium sp. M7A.F.Ca.US.003.02.1.1]RUZ58547.1 BA14K family protein [Mesorhizobium sp. M7A.F.Ca.US.003.02.2.1]RVA05321.1 BA14K family protein [Mesorhizobium sp. M7A.F.Ca.US.001.02.1.1]RVA09021.1 BA14K family protein [Mesorhizobium sp. M7A.F.Ca.US.002.01.1.1]
MFVGAAFGSLSASSRHVRWCYDDYRSYRRSDNTFQACSGPRRQCRRG